MRPLRNICFVALFLFLRVGLLFSQEYNKLPSTLDDYPRTPFFIFNNAVISKEVPPDISTKKVKSIKVFRDKNPQCPYPNLVSYAGLVVIEGTFNVKSSKTQSELNLFFGLNPSNPMYLNGYLIDNPNLRILPYEIESINRVHLPNGEGDSTDYLNIELLKNKDSLDITPACRMLPEGF